MPNRILKNSICDSDNIDLLSPDAEVLFYRLIVNCDDYGRMDGRPAVVIARCFPLKITKISDDLISIWLKELEINNLLKSYNVGNHPYIKLCTWENHQSIRAKRSKYPSPDDNGNTSENICNQMITTASKCPRNPIQSNPIRESNPIPAGGFLEKEKQIIKLYGDNISVNVTPIIVDELKKMAKLYDITWVEYAMGEAVKHNVHNLQYVKTILENCAIKGFIPNAPQKETNPRKVVYQELK